MVIAGLALGGGAAAPAPAGVASPAATPTLPSLVAYVRSGDVFISKGAAEQRLTTGGGYSRPQWSPDGSRLAVLRGGQLWTMKSDGSGKRRLTTRSAAGPSWSPDGAWIAFSSLSCSGGPGVYRISVKSGATPQVLFPAECRTEPLPAEPAVEPGGTAGSLTDRLRYDDTVAWSPDGSKLAFRGGQCESTYDACLSVGTIANGGERTVDAYGGGSLEYSGFAVLPTWRPDGRRLAYTAYQEGDTAATDKPVHVVEYDPATGARRTIGTAQDRELAYVSTAKAVITGQYRSSSWLFVVSLSSGARTPFHAGSQASIRPVA